MDDPQDSQTTVIDPDASSAEAPEVATVEEATERSAQAAVDDEAPSGPAAVQVVADEDSEASASGDGDSEADDEDFEGAADAAPGSRLETEAEVAADYLEELLDIADLDGDLDTYVDGDRAHVSILADTEQLVGANGEVLESLQELARLAVLTETGDRSRLMLDIGGYRERRRKELTNLANDAVTEVKESSERVVLSAMNAFERKIVHDVVAGAGLSSESEGEDPNRRVVVLPSA